MCRNARWIKGKSFGVAHRAGQAQLQQHGLFFFPHPHSFQAAVLMVVAQQMQHGMHGQKCHFPLQRMAVERCLLLGCWKVSKNLQKELKEEMETIGEEEKSEKDGDRTGWHRGL